jgi:DNA-binding GntR family transcriptional regulator
MATIERPRSLTSVVAERLRASIIDGTIGLGSLLSEKVLAEKFGTSKTPVREAIVQLQSMGLVEVLPQRGGVVFRPTVEQVRELCEVRLELEVAAFRFSMERNREALAKALADIVRRMVDAYDVKRPLAYQRLDNELHSCFFEHCGNTLLAKAYELFAPRICALRTHLSTPQPQLLEQSLAEHKALLKFVRKGDVSSGVQLLQAHINRTRDCHSKRLTEAGAARRRA